VLISTAALRKNTTSNSFFFFFGVFDLVTALLLIRSCGIGGGIGYRQRARGKVL
jgi:hypothetical protein